MFARPPPKKKPRRGVVVVPVSEPLPLPLPPGAPPGGEPLPAGRAGRVTPWAFRHEASCARRALKVLSLPAVPAPDPEVEADAEGAVALVVLLELLALPQAVSRQPAATAATATAVRPDRI
jgi:hypothetical protein